jgi:SOS-response transcriptional repressor LexA
MKFGDRIKQLRTKANLTQVELAEKAGVSPGQISLLENSERKITQDSFNKVIDALGIKEEEFFGYGLTLAGIPDLHPRPIPVISWVNAGLFADAEDHWPVGVSSEGDPVFSYRKVGLHAFGLRVVGDSMAPRYLPGDTIIVDPEIRCDNGSPCVVVLDGKATFKFFKETEDLIILEPMNQNHREIIIRKSRPGDFRVVGKVVDLIPKMDIPTSSIGFADDVTAHVVRDGKNLK